MDRFLLGALAPIILKWPRSVQRGESAPPLDFGGTGNAWSPPQHLLLTVGSLFPVHAGCGGSGIESRIRIVAIFRRKKPHMQRWCDAVHADSRLRLSSRIQPGRFAYLISAKKAALCPRRCTLVRLEAEVVV